MDAILQAQMEEIQMVQSNPKGFFLLPTPQAFKEDYHLFILASFSERKKNTKIPSKTRQKYQMLQKIIPRYPLTKKTPVKWENIYICHILIKCQIHF